MATNARGASNKAKNSNMAAMMKAKGIRRTTGRCCLCNRIIGIPTDRHFYGKVCK